MDATYENVIEQIADSIFATMLSLQVARVDEPAALDEDALLATVHIAGQWMGSVVLALSPGVATRAAAAMLELPVAEVTADDRHDVASELVNMIGGNLKSLLPAPSFLSLPTVVVGRELDVQIHQAELINDVLLGSEAGSLQIRLYVQEPAVA